MKTLQDLLAGCAGLPASTTTFCRHEEDGTITQLFANIFLAADGTPMQIAFAPAAFPVVTEDKGADAPDKTTDPKPATPAVPPTTGKKSSPVSKPKA